MRITLTLVGSGLIIIYSVLGALLMTNWAVAAASGVSLEEAVAEMQIVDQPYSVVPGFVFASLGSILAIVWAFMVMSPKLKISAWLGTALWSAIITLGAPAYFFASFGNMNSVGDTFYEWDAAASLRLETPLYLMSGFALLVGITALTLSAIHTAKRRKTTLNQTGSSI